MAGRFQQFAVSDSDEDSSASEVVERREQRSAGGGTAADTPLPVATPNPMNQSVSSAKPPSVAPPASSKNVSAPHVATPLSHSMASSHNFVVESTPRGADSRAQRAISTDATSISFQVDPTPHRAAPPLSSSQQSIDFSMAVPSSVPSVRDGPLKPAPAAPRRPTAPPPREDSEGSIFFAMDDRSQRTGSQPPAMDANGATPRESVASATSDGHSKKGTKVVRRKVVVRGRKGADPSDPGEVVHVDEQVIRPGRSGDGASLPPPPPPRVSPRARQAAASRSASRAVSPAEGRHAAGGGLRGAAPPIPATRADSRSVSPRVPQSARSHRTSGSAAAPLLPAASSHRSSARHESPRTPAIFADSPVEFEVVPDTASGTPNFRTDDTISFNVERTSGATPQRTRDRAGANTSAARRHPQIPSPSALDDGPTPVTVDESGQIVPMHRAKVQRTVTADGRATWMLYGAHRGDADGTKAHEIAAPPRRLSHRAQDILAAKRRAMEEGAKKRHAEVVKRHAETAKGSTEAAKRNTRTEKRLSIANRTRNHLAFQVASFYSDDVAREHAAAAAQAQDHRWTEHAYDGLQGCADARRASTTAASRWDTEKVVRALQPVQVAPQEGTTGTCGCVVDAAAHEDAALRHLIDSNAARDDGIRRYLNLQPMQLANVEMQEMVDPSIESPRRGSVSPSEVRHPGEATPRSAIEQRNLATLGGLWCTAEALREDGRSAARKDAPAARRVMRICGGQAIAVPLSADSGETLDARCYELLLFPRESLSPSAVNYGSDGLTLGQVIAPPASTFPLTPRILDDPVALKEYKKRLLTTKTRQVAMANSEDDRATFAGGAARTPSKGQYLTLTMVTISSRHKHTIELTLVLLPFRCAAASSGRLVAEVPRFCASTVMTYRRLHGLSLSFSTKSAFMSAYKALLWATECDIVDVQPADADDCIGPSAAYSKLRVCATTSPMVPWVASFGAATPGQPKEDTFRGNCIDFAVLALAAPPGAIQRAEPDPRDPLTLEDFVIDDGEGGAAAEADDGAISDISVATSRQRRRSSIFHSTLNAAKPADGEEEDKAPPSSDTVVGLTAFGVIRRAVSQRTSEVFDVRVMPRNRGRMAPTTGDDPVAAAAAAAGSAEGPVNGSSGQAARMQEEHLLEQDAEAAIVLEYISRLPFHSRIYGVLVDEQRYYIFQEPWISALALEEGAAGSAEHDALECNEKLKAMTRATTVMSLKDFIHAVLRPTERGAGPKEEVRLEIAHVLAAQLLLLLTSLHGKGMLLGPCPPQRLLVRVTDPAPAPEEAASDPDTPDKKKAARQSPAMTAANIHVFVPDIGVNTLAWGYERQQCGVLEYLPPMYVLEQMLADASGQAERPWTMRDDWWTYLTLCFELFAGDGSALVAPPVPAAVPTPTPTLTKFFSPVKILDVWQDVITDSSAGVSGTAADTVALRTRRYVHQRVLQSVSRSLDTWVAAKAEEMQYFGTTAPRRGRRIVRAVPPQSSAQGRSQGVSLAAVYLQSAREASDTSSIAFQTDNDEAGSSAVAAENVLADMPWLFQLRDFVDSVVDAVFAPAPCDVHGPALRLVSHPFFNGLRLARVFDGTHEYSSAVADYAAKHLAKARVQAALVAYRTRAYRGPGPRRPEVPLMIASSAYNAAGRANSAAPLLLLSSPACHDERPDASSVWPDAEADPTEGLVFSRSNSAAASPSAPSPRSVPGGWGQQMLKAMYNPEEWQSLAALETEVRGALNSHGPRESVSSRRASAEVHYAPHAAATTPAAAYRTAQPVRQTSGLAQADAASVTSSGRRRDPRSYEHVVDAAAAPSSVAPPAQHRSLRSSAASSYAGDATGTTSRPAYGQTGAAAPVTPLEPGALYNSHLAARHSSDRGIAAGVRASPKEAPPVQRPHRYNSGMSDFERSLNDLVESRPRHDRDDAALSSSHNSSGGGVGTGFGPGNAQRQAAGAKPSSRPSSRHGGDRHHQQQQQEHQEYGSQRSWPNEFLDAATVQKKGQPHRFSDPQTSALDRLTIDQQTQQSLRSVGSHSHHGGSIVHAGPAGRPHQDNSSEDSYMLVTSDGDVDTEHAPASTYRSSVVQRESPAPRNPRASHTGEVASNRETYFAF